MSKVHRLRSSDRIFFITVNLRRALVPLADGEFGLVTDALVASRRKKSPRHKNVSWLPTLGGIPNKTQVGDLGIDGRIYPLSAVPHKAGKAAGELDFMDDWYPIQVKQGDKVGRPDVDKFEAAMIRAKRKKGFFVGFDFSHDALAEIGAFFKAQHTVIVPLTVREILDEQIAQKLA